MASHTEEKETEVITTSVDTASAAAALSSALSSISTAGSSSVSRASAESRSMSEIPMMYRVSWYKQFEKLIINELTIGDKLEDEYLQNGIPKVIILSVLDFHDSRGLGTREWRDFIDAILYCAVISYERRQAKQKPLYKSRELWYRIDDYHNGVLTVPKGMRSGGSIIAFIDRQTLQIIPGLQFPELSEIQLDHSYRDSSVDDESGVPKKKEKSANFVPFKLVYDLERGAAEEEGWTNIYAFGRYYTVQYISEDRVIALGTYDKTRFLYLRKNDFFIVVCGLTLSINDPRCFHSAPSARNYLPLVCDALKFTS